MKSHVVWSGLATRPTKSFVQVEELVTVVTATTPSIHPSISSVEQQLHTEHSVTDLMQKLAHFFISLLKLTIYWTFHAFGTSWSHSAEQTSGWVRVGWVQHPL